MLLRLVKKILTTLLTLTILVLVALAAYLAISTMRTERQPEQDQFLAGTAEPPPPGTYQGHTSLPLSAWRGKLFSPDGSSGLNLFARQGALTRQYEFKITAAEALRDPDRPVTRLDYNHPANPWYVRIFLTEEIVKIADNQYLGKIHLRFLPNLEFTLGFFTLTPVSG